MWAIPGTNDHDWGTREEESWVVVPLVRDWCGEVGGDVIGMVMTGVGM